MSAFTPGPWKIESGGHDQLYLICSPHLPPDDPGLAWIEDLKEGVDGYANARLIAAAPEMLELLKLVRDNMEKLGIPCGYCAPGYTEQRAMLDVLIKVAAVIDKVELPEVQASSGM